MCAGGGDIPNTLCVPANNRRDADANIRHSNSGPGGPRQLWLEVRLQRLPKERGWIKTMSSFEVETPGRGGLFKARNAITVPVAELGLRVCGGVAVPAKKKRASDLSGALEHN